MEEHIYINTSSTVSKRERNFGYWLLSIVLFVCGQHLRIPPATIKLTPFWKCVHTVHSALVLLSLFFFVSVAAAALVEHLGNFQHAIFIAAGFMGVLECLIRSVYTTLRKNKIEQIATKIQFGLDELESCDTKSFTKRLSKIISAFLVILLSFFSVALICNLITLFARIEAELAYDGRDVDTAVSFKIFRAFIDFCEFFNFRPSNLQSEIFMTFMYSLSFLSICRLVVSNILFCSWYLIIAKMYQQLTKNFTRALSTEKSLSDWIKHHSKITELTTEINRLTAPIVVVTVVFTGLQISITAFTVAKRWGVMDFVPYVAFAASSFQQIFIYCVLGQKIKTKIMALQHQIYNSPWLESSPVEQNAVLVIYAVASDKLKSSLPGSPFFSMSMEFFATAVGAIFTYFIVLIQLG
ncbi:putative odorant receptor 92a isoform X2 [Neocloeon triangulifer]|uniref:putative odorant receptor 92a isoform X2 n=1 Tax=Neocloeon triangulifer TaxID=2078957 RepID=UPI00286F7CC0|nr:putative odorant receptor 92a isoform X2 [Neocloeon triangulifer]